MVAAICRVFGPQMAELPLIATKNTARRQGHARILVNCFEALLRNVSVLWGDARGQRCRGQVSAVADKR